MKKILTTLAAVLCCAMTTTVLTSCSISDNPVPVTDNGRWDLSDAEMDTSVRPGNDFYMYCNGGYWNSTEVDESKADIKSLFKVDMPNIIKQRMAALPFPTLDKLMADAEKADSAEIAAWLKAATDRIDAVNTCEEAWLLFGQLINEGHATKFAPAIFSKRGHIGVAFNVQKTDYEAVMEMPDKTSFQWQLLNNPDVLAAVRPLGGSGSRRAYNHGNWPMLTTIFTELGFNLDDVYSIDETILFPQEMMEGITASFMSMQYDLDELKSTMTQCVLADTALLDAKNRSEMVKKLADKYLRYEKSYIYANAYVTPEMKQRTLEYCDQLRKSFRQRIANNEWMSQASKTKAIEKLDAMIFNIGCPDEWFPEGFADISSQQSLIGDIVSLRQADLNLMRKLAGMESSKASWHALLTKYDLTVVNAFYTQNYNAMNIYPTWMAEPLYDPQMNDAHNYATMMAFGHEITHGFDTNGAKFNKIGDPDDIWGSDADRQEFQKRAQQLADCFSSLEVMPWALPGIKNDGAYTVAENIADLGGILMVYDTYVRHLREAGFSGEQFNLQCKRFFIAIAKLWQSKYSAKYALRNTNGDGEEQDGKDNHSLSRERINGNMMNIDAWYDFFDVKPSDKLYRAPNERVRIW